MFGLMRSTTALRDHRWRNDKQNQCWASWLGSQWPRMENWRGKERNGGVIINILLLALCVFAYIINLRPWGTNPTSMYSVLALIPGSKEETGWSQPTGKHKTLTKLESPASAPLSSKISCLLFFIPFLRSKLFYLFRRYSEEPLKVSLKDGLNLNHRLKLRLQREQQARVVGPLSGSSIPSFQPQSKVAFSSKALFGRSVSPKEQE